MTMADPTQTKISGRLMRRAYCTLDRWSFWLRIIGMVLALSASSVLPLQLYASLPQTYDGLFSLMRANCLSLRPPATKVDDWLQAVSSAGLCALPWSTRSRIPFLSSLKSTALGLRISSILVTWPAQRSCTWGKMDSMLGRLALLRTSSFDA